VLLFLILDGHRGYGLRLYTLGHCLETNAQIWSPHLLKDIRRIEAVQRRFTKKSDGLHSFDYAKRLSLLGLKRLQERRIRADLLFAYKLLFGSTSLPDVEKFDDVYVHIDAIAQRGQKSDRY